MEDPTFEVRWIDSCNRRHTRTFGKTESQEAMFFAKSKPRWAHARVVKIQTLWSTETE